MVTEEEREDLLLLIATTPALTVMIATERRVENQDLPLSAEKARETPDPLAPSPKVPTTHTASNPTTQVPQEVRSSQDLLQEASLLDLRVQSQRRTAMLKTRRRLQSRKLQLKSLRKIE